MLCLTQDDPQDNAVAKDGDDHDQGKAEGPDCLPSCPRIRGKADKEKYF